MPLAELYVTDGTTTVDFLNGALCLVDWRPSYPGMKGGGTWQSSPLADGRRLAQYRYNHVVDVFSLEGRGRTQDAMIRELQELNRLLIKARQYWTADWQDEPVYLVAKASRETNRRYALIHSYDFPSDGAPYGQPFAKNWGRTGMEGLTLAVEHALWQSTIPGEGTCTEVYATEDYEGVTYGREHGVCPANLGEVFVANKDVMANITHIYWRDAVPGVWSGNLVGTMPYSLFRPGFVIATGDYVLFGIETALGAGLYTLPVFSSLVFDLIPAVYTGVARMDWYYSNGAGGWIALPAGIMDNTAAAANQPLSVAGVTSVHWTHPGNWAEDPDGPAATNCLWIKLEATVTTPPGDSISIPQQQTRDVYQVAWPYVETNDEDVEGDVSAIIRAVTPNLGSAGALYRRLERLVLGLRSLNRGIDFTPYINCGDEQNHASIAVTVQPLVGATFANQIRSGAGRVVNWISGGVVTPAIRIILIAVNSPLCGQYYGSYRAFLRVRGVGAGISTTFHLRIYSGSAGTIWTGPEDTYTWGAAATEAVFELGSFTLPGAGILRSSEYTDWTEIDVYVSCTANITIDVLDLILMPTDEWSGDFVMQSTSGYVDVADELHIDSIHYPKRDLRAVVFVTATQLVMDVWATLANGPAILQANKDQRLWFFVAKTTHTEPEICFGVDIDRAQRYLSMRGDR